MHNAAYINYKAFAKLQEIKTYFLNFFNKKINMIQVITINKVKLGK